MLPPAISTAFRFRYEFLCSGIRKNSGSYVPLPASAHFGTISPNHFSSSIGR